MDNSISFKINKRLVGTGLFILILILIAFFALTLSKAGLKVLFSINWKYILALFLLWTGYIAFDSIKFMLVSLIGEKKINVFIAFKTIIIGVFLAAITPFQVSGLPVQIYYLTANGIGAGEASSYLLLRGFVTFTGILSFALPYAYVFRNTFEGVMRGIYLYALFVVGIITVVYILVMFLPKVLSKIIRGRAYEELLMLRKVFWDALKGKKGRQKLLGAFASTLVSLVFLGTIPYVIHRALGLNLFTVQKSIGYQTIAISSLLFTPTPGGSGLAEAAGSFIFLKGAGKVYVFPFVVLWRFFTFYITAVFGAIFFFIEGKKLIK